MDVRERIMQRIPDGLWHDLAIRDGWLPLVDELDRALAEIDPDYQLHQCKEKFGGLRYYVGLSSTLDPRQLEKCRMIIRSAEALSMRLCDICGQPGKQRESRRWLATRCEAHADTEEEL